MDYKGGFEKATFSLAPLGKCSDHCLLIERMWKHGNLFLPSKHAFIYPTQGFIVQARFTQENHDQKSPSKSWKLTAISVMFSLCLVSTDSFFYYLQLDFLAQELKGKSSCFFLFFTFPHLPLLSLYILSFSNLLHLGRKTVLPISLLKLKVKSLGSRDLALPLSNSVVLGKLLICLSIPLTKTRTLLLLLSLIHRGLCKE